MPKRKSKAKTIIIILSIVFVIAIIAFMMLMPKGPVPLEVTTGKVERKNLTMTIQAVGNIVPEVEVKISSETSGEIEVLPVKEGQIVKKGDLLVKIKQDIIETQLDQFKAAVEASAMEIEVRKAELERAKNELMRVTELYKKEFASKQELDRAKAAFDQADASYRASIQRKNQAIANLEQFRRTAARSEIRSPISGIINKLSVEIGEKVVGTAQMQGTEMMRVSDFSTMLAVVDVDENDVVYIKIGDTAKIEVDALPDVVLLGTVIEVKNAPVKSQLGTQDEAVNFPVKIRIIDKEQRLRPGMSCNVEIATETRNNVLAIPIEAVTIRDSKKEKENQQQSDGIRRVEEQNEKKPKTQRAQSVVFIKDNNIARMIPVKTGISDKGFIEIVEGLKENDEIIIGSFDVVTNKLRDSSLIRVAAPENKKK